MKNMIKKPDILQDNKRNRQFEGAGKGIVLIEMDRGKAYAYAALHMKYFSNV